jgi:hypothetical protein
MTALNTISKEHGVYNTIFVDGAYLLRLYELKNHYPELEKDWSAVEANLVELNESGQDIQFHFHPQWLFSNFNKTAKGWDIDDAHYKMSDIEDISLLEDSFSKSKRLVEQIIGKRLTAFRAGGYCLEGINYQELFNQNDILIDSSVARNLKYLSETHTYDYSVIPSKTIYTFANSVHEEELSKKHGFLEVSISSKKWSSFQYLFYFRRKYKSYSPKVVYRDGEPIRDKGRTSPLKNVIKSFRGLTTLCSIDGANSLFLEDYYNSIKRTGDKNMVLIGHPKNASELSISKLEEFIIRHKQTDTFMTMDSLKNSISKW